MSQAHADAATDEPPDDGIANAVVDNVPLEGQAATTGSPDPLAPWQFVRDGFALSDTTRPFCLEIFAGSGRLTRCLRARGLDAWAVDWKGGKLTTETPAVMMFDLSITRDKDSMKRLLTHPRLTYVHMAPPCGTCSRARGIPLASGQPGPAPLRSEAHPLGIPDLERLHPREVPRVLAANVLYDFSATIAEHLIDNGIAWSMESPRDSLLWYIPKVRRLTDRLDTAFVHFQRCAYSASRPKWTGWLHWPGGMFDSLHGDGQVEREREGE